MLGMMQVSKRIPFDDPFTLSIVRACYVASNVIIALLYLYVQAQINKKKGIPPLQNCAGNDVCHCRDMLADY